MKGNFLNTIKIIYEKFASNIITNREKLKALPLRSGVRHWYPLSPLLFSIVLEVLVREVRQERKIKGIQVGKEEVNFSLFTWDMIFYVENPNVSTHRKLLEVINEFSKVTRYKVSTQKLVAFLYSSKEQSKQEIIKTIWSTITLKKNKILSN